MDTIIKLILVLTLLLFVISWIATKFGGGSKVYVAMLVSDSNELQDTKIVTIIGVFRKKETAEAKLYNYSKNHGRGRESNVIECVINKDFFANADKK